MKILIKVLVFMIKLISINNIFVLLKIINLKYATTPSFLKKMITLLFLSVVSLTTGQIIFTTVPGTDNGPAYVLAEEGALNVSLYCYVVSNNIQVQTRWLVKRSTDSMLVLTEYNITGKLTSPVDLVGKIIAIGNVISGFETTYQNNLTILNFTREFNLVQMKCGPQGTVREFNLGFPGMIIYLYFTLIIHIN